MPLTRCLASALALAFTTLPMLAGGLACPPGWSNDTTGCDPVQCRAPMGSGLIRVDRYASVPGTTLAEALASLAKAIGADGTPLDVLVGEREVEVTGLAGLRRDYTGSARGADLHVVMVLVRHDGQDMLLRAMWDLDQDALSALLLDPVIDGWAPREPE